MHICIQLFSHKYRKTQRCFNHCLTCSLNNTTSILHILLYFCFIYMLLICKYYKVLLSFTYFPATTKMDIEYLNILANFCRPTKEQQATLQQFQAHFQSTSSLPFNYIYPTITLLSETLCMARQDLIIRKPHLASQINCTWCCHCHSPTYIYD